MKKTCSMMLALLLVLTLMPIRTAWANSAGEPCPEYGKYQAMKTAYVKNVRTGRRITASSVTIGIGEEEAITIRPDYEYSIADFNKRPRLYPNQMLYDIGDKSFIQIRKPDGSVYTGGMIDGNAKIIGLEVGRSRLICKAPNGRTYVLTVIVR